MEGLMVELKTFLSLAFVFRCHTKVNIKLALGVIFWGKKSLTSTISTYTTTVLYD